MERVGVNPLERCIVHESDRYKLVKVIGAGNFGVTRLMHDVVKNELVAVKYIERGEKIDENVRREIINHRSLKHPNIIRFKELILTPTHLAIVMEYADGGELFERIDNAGHFSEDEARYFFHQLISGVSYCHSLEICHRDLKLENTLLNGSPASQLKICDFGYSKSSVLHSQPKSTVGTPAYIAPEILSQREYDGKVADVWSCGVTLFVMLVGVYPFEDPQVPRNLQNTVRRILNVQYSIPHHLQISEECRDLVARIFVAIPEQRITMEEIKKHAWFVKNLPMDLAHVASSSGEPNNGEPTQTDEDIMQIIADARVPGPDSLGIDQFLDDSSLDFDELDYQIDSEFEEGSSGEDFVYAS